MGTTVKYKVSIQGPGVNFLPKTIEASSLSSAVQQRIRQTGGSYVEMIRTDLSKTVESGNKYTVIIEVV